MIAFTSQTERLPWRMIAEEMIEMKLSLLLDSDVEARAISIALRRLGKIPYRTKLHGMGWIVSATRGNEINISADLEGIAVGRHSH